MDCITLDCSRMGVAMPPAVPVPTVIRAHDCTGFVEFIAPSGALLILDHNDNVLVNTRRDIGTFNR